MAQHLNNNFLQYTELNAIGFKTPYKGEWRSRYGKEWRRRRRRAWCDGSASSLASRYLTPPVLLVTVRGATQAKDTQWTGERMTKRQYMQASEQTGRQADTRANCLSTYPFLMSQVRGGV